ncbi:hypothetical protein [Flavobacterium hiemivividum]|uniref:Beta-lactamase-inhibitor-like PepSY-like domain-containing protein n=1 Tax=Flavobacterium hiemivividum TaxID=2541734 RepID=A0A4R5D0K4_9FLAO|nr:hypothetical protein [Flavobacterium hiemivividum]TDE06546.1 hypothetical protein E0F98_02725 [Flavobacterium hiemivividum]
MKKLILSAAIVLGSLTTMSAQVQEETKEATTTEQTAPATDVYTEIKMEELPAAITEALKKAYPEAVVSKAYINDKKEYKLDVTVGEKAGSLFADANGNWIQK